MKIGSILVEAAVTSPTIIRNHRHEYQLAAAIHGALGRELSRPDSRVPEGLFKRPGLPAPIILRRVLYDSEASILGCGEPVDIEILCFGDAVEHREAIAEALVLALARGVGGPAPGHEDRGRLAVVSCRMIGAPMAPNGSHEFLLKGFTSGASLRFWSPAALKWNPQAEPFAHDDLAKAIFQRIECTLIPAYGGDNLVAPRDSWSHLTSAWRWSAEDRWTPHLHDGRASKQAAYRGVVGELEILGDARNILETLWWGSWTGIGEGTAIGLGQYSVLPLQP